VNSPLVTAVNPDEIEVIVGVFPMSLPRQAAGHPTNQVVQNSWNSQISGQGRGSTSRVIMNYIPDPIEGETPPHLESVASAANSVFQPPQVLQEEPVISQIGTDLLVHQHQENKVEGLCCSLS